MIPSPMFVEPTPFEVYAIRYATVARRSAENFIGGDPHEAGGTMESFDLDVAQKAFLAKITEAKAALA